MTFNLFLSSKGDSELVCPQKNSPHISAKLWLFHERLILLCLKSSGRYDALTRPAKVMNRPLDELGTRVTEVEPRVKRRSTSNLCDTFRGAVLRVGHGQTRRIPCAPFDKREQFYCRQGQRYPLQPRESVKVYLPLSSGIT